MAKTKEDEASYLKAWRIKNPDKVKEYSDKILKGRADLAKIKKDLRVKEIEKRAKNKNYMRELKLKNRQEYAANIRDSRIRGLLKSQGFKVYQITPELIELKRITLKTTRLCRQLKA